MWIVHHVLDTCLFVSLHISSKSPWIAVWWLFFKILHQKSDVLNLVSNFWIAINVIDFTEDILALTVLRRSGVLKGTHFGEKNLSDTFIEIETFGRLRNIWGIKNLSISYLLCILHVIFPKGHNNYLKSSRRHHTSSENRSLAIQYVEL